MLPRRFLRHAQFGSLGAALIAGLFAVGPTQAITKYEPPVNVQSVAPKYRALTNAGATKTIEVLSDSKTEPFSIVGITWEGILPSGSTFKVRVKESGKWSSWSDLEFSDDHGVDPASAEAVGTRNGTDPLMTAVATGIQVRMLNKSGKHAKNLRVELIGSNLTATDRSLVAVTRMANTVSSYSNSAVTPSGGVVPRPLIVSRAQWGANESWRDPVPKMGTKIKAGFIHHTASTNNYSPEQAPAQMRALYAYYTKSLKYADMAYNFLVDQYGTVYEGRNACPYVANGPCDGPTLPGQGAHTAGFNPNTFAISAIGNYDTKKPSHPEEMIESIASLMAWKIAPYGLDPNGNAKLVSLDTSGLSKYSKGKTAITPIISGHRDVGKTACPGRYLYPLIPQIRARATELLQPVIHDFGVTPEVVEVTDTQPVQVSAVIPAAATWSVTVSNVVDGSVLKSVTGTQVATDAISYTWDRTDALGAAVLSGRYLVTVNSQLGTKALPTAKSEVVVATKPTKAKKISVKKKTKTTALVKWTTSSVVLPISRQYVRVSADKGKTWGPWIRTKKAASELTLVDLKKGTSYQIEIKVRNKLGYSTVVTKTYKMR